MRISRLPILVSLFFSVANGRSADDEPQLPNFAVVHKMVRQQLASGHATQRGGLISQHEVAPIFQQLQQLGWDVTDRDEILQDVLPIGDPVVTILRSPKGRKFASQVAGYKLIYDRLDRIVREPGGQRLLRDLVKLPDAARYAKQNTGVGVPNLVDFLPKTRSGKTRAVKDYEKPTGKIYTSEQLLGRLRKSHHASKAALDKCQQ